MARTKLSDLPEKLVHEMILTRIPITSLRAVRSTCKSWDALSEDLIIDGKAEARQQFLGFMMKDFKVWSLRFDVRNKPDVIHIKPVDLLDQVQVLKSLYCDGLLLCVARDLSRLVVWNPYLGQTRSILPRTDNFHRLDRYALGYDTNHNHKILRFIDERSPHMLEFEIYDFSSGSWKVLEPTPNCHIEYHQRSVSIKGVAYFYSQELVYGPLVEILPGGPNGKRLKKIKDFLVSFDFTTEKFGPRMHLPFQSNLDDTVTLSCVGQEQLAVLCYQSPFTLEIWVTTKIEPNFASWSNFFKVDTKPLVRAHFHFTKIYGGSFFIDEEKKVAVLFGTDGTEIRTSGTDGNQSNIVRYNTVYILGEDGCSEPTRLGEALSTEKPDKSGYIPFTTCVPLVCPSAYFPSLVQVTQSERAQRKRKDRDDGSCPAQRRRKDKDDGSCV